MDIHAHILIYVTFGRVLFAMVTLSLYVSLLPRSLFGDKVFRQIGNFHARRPRESFGLEARTEAPRPAATGRNQFYEEARFARDYYYHYFCDKFDAACRFDGCEKQLESVLHSFEHL